MAPEVVQGVPYDSKCDVYSFAIIMYQVYFETLSPYGDANNTYGVEQRSSQEEDFRPRMPNDESKFNYKEKVVLELIRKSWAHAPSARPDFSVICKLLEPFVKMNS